MFGRVLQEDNSTKREPDVSMISVRLMRAVDVPWACELSCHAGWNQLPADWRLLIDLEPKGVFVAEDDGRPCGTASIVAYGSEIGWIGMVLVHRDFRRRGIGTLLVEHCLKELRQRGVCTAWLDATDLGREVYRKTGFCDVRPIARYAGLACERGRSAGRGRTMSSADLEAIRSLDETAFGATRIELLAGLLDCGRGYVVGDRASPRGYGLSRSGREAEYIGPVVARDANAAEQIVAALLAGLAGRQVFWDIPGGNPDAAAMAEELGFTVARRLTRMCLGEVAHTGRAELVYAAAGFELG
jgi:GNAT superfamily N-acetyltransferase